MRFFLASILLALATQASGCIGCGGYTGGGDRVYLQGDSMLILCANDGFVATLADGTTLEGTYAEANDAGTATEGATGELAFGYTIAADGTLTSPDLAAGGAWAEQSLDKTALDHADIRCTDLTQRAWWPAASQP